MSEKVSRAIDHGMTACHTCSLVVRIGNRAHARCPRCHSAVHMRVPHSVQRTWALLIAAAIMYAPANLLPIMTIRYFGEGQPDTIMSGVILLVTHGMWPLALIVFVASILVPMLKLTAMTYLLISVQRSSSYRPRQRAGLYRLTELVGRWSMVDIFVVAILTALVQLGGLASIEPGLGAAAFACVVISTMFAAMTFDPRLIWDRVEQ